MFLASFVLSFVSPAAADTCVEVQTCEVVGSYESCRYNRRGQLVCDILPLEECTTSLECYPDENLGGGDCYYETEILACLLG